MLLINSEYVASLKAEELNNLLLDLRDACAATNGRFMLVGAIARSILLTYQLESEEEGRQTRDVDIVAWAEDEEKYHALLTSLQNKGYTKKASDPIYRLWSPDGLPVDLLPFGPIEQNRRIFPEAHEDVAMNMLGFQEAYEHALDAQIADGPAFKLLDHLGYILVKIFAWKDKQPDRISRKHSEDIAIIIQAVRWQGTGDWDETAQNLGKALAERANDSKNLAEGVASFLDDLEAAIDKEASQLVVDLSRFLGLDDDARSAQFCRTLIAAFRAARP